MPVTIAHAAGAKALNVLGEELRPLTPAGGDRGTEIGVAVFDTIAPATAPGEAGPPPHRHPWAEIYVCSPGRSRFSMARPGMTRQPGRASACRPASGTLTATAPPTVTS